MLRHIQTDSLEAEITPISDRGGACRAYETDFIRERNHPIPCNMYEIMMMYDAWAAGISAARAEPVVPPNISGYGVNMSKQHGYQPDNAVQLTKTSKQSAGEIAAKGRKLPLTVYSIVMAISRPTAI